LPAAASAAKKASQNGAGPGDLLGHPQGRLVEQGTHEELRARAGIYRNLYELQYQSAGLGTAS